MSKHRHYFTDESLNLNQANSYNLLLQINANSFNYAITFNKLLLSWVEDYPLDELKDLQALQDILTANYKQVIIGLASTGFTLLPNNLFDKDYVADIARLLDVQDNENVHFQPVDNDNIIIYKVNQNLTANLSVFNNPAVNYKAKGWITAIANSEPADTNLYVNIADGTVEFLNFSNTNLRFYNTFTYKNHEELAYYSAFVAKELNLDAQNITIIMSGDVNQADKCVTYLAEFFNEVKLNTIELLELPQKVDPHKILTLAALSLCASSEEN
ncbi:DUF3822 family protein [Mucilaginibacter sp.]|jgi:hypothetical protein|uniref:DUF3822 family protein n=1 Tax=Mucilaginibacter sp. TaxID=1882438 RepID=UPI0035689460